MAAAELGRRDVLMYINSERIVRTLPEHAQDQAISALRAEGYYTFLVSPSALGGHTGGGASVFDAGEFGRKPVVSEELSEEERAQIALVYRCVHERGMTLHVVDVGRESALRRVISEHLHRLSCFPVLVRPDGRRLEGSASFTLANLTTFLSD